MFKMKKEKVIEKILGEVLLKEGFTLKCEGNVWSFEREWQNKAGETIHQMVYVQQSDFDKKLYFRFQTNAYGRVVEEAQKIDKDYPNTQDSYYYQDEQGFIKQIEHFAKLMKSEGFKFLEQISEPTVEERPTGEQEVFLFKNHKCLTAKLIEEHGFTLECDREQLLNVIFEIIKPFKNNVYHEVSDTLIKLAAFYGSWIATKYKGKWVYDDAFTMDTRVEYISEGGYTLNTAPLSRIFLCWQRVCEYDELKYKEIQKSILGI